MLIDRLIRPVRGRAGFTLTETLVAVAITSVVAGVLIAGTARPRVASDVTAMSQMMSGFLDAIHAYRGDVGRYPTTLMDLTTPPVAPKTDSCGRPVPDHFLAEWRGPYLSRGVQPTGVPVGAALVRTTLQRSPATVATTSHGLLLVQADDVDRAVAEAMEAAYDGDKNLASGTIRWVVTEGGRGRLTFAVPIRGC